MKQILIDFERNELNLIILLINQIKLLKFQTNGI